MRITGFDISEGRIGGLKALKADKLGDVVVLAGRNGAGKSRLIQFLLNWKSTSIDSSLSPSFYSPQAIFESAWNDESIKAKAKTWNDWCKDTHLLGGITRLSLPLCRPDMDLARQLLEISFNDIHEPEIVHFVPKQIGLADPRNQTKADRAKRAELADSTVGIEKLEHNALARIQHLQDRYMEVTHPGCRLDESVKSKCSQEYEALQSLIERFLGQTLDRDQDGDATLFGLRIGEGNFSDGQSILLQFCVAIHAQADRLSELIIMMDEPENHLHPAAMLDAINVIKGHLTNGQLWIATHSLPLLANFDPDCIRWMDQGTISHAGSNPEVVLQGLLGDAERIEQLENFLGLPAAMAVNNFTAQCLLPPAVVMTGSEDKQLMLIRNALSALKPAERPLRVLDVGAGRGRLISALAASLPDAAHTLDYLAFDPSGSYKQECEDAIARCYAGETERRWFGSMEDLKAKHSSKTMDVVVMCNVLHEIDPCTWLSSLFGTHGTVGHFLKANGYLLIVEDTEMRIGEKAHEKGFLVLNTGNLRTLFAVTENDPGFKSETQQNGRLIATLIPADCLSRANKETLIKTLDEVKHEASDKIRALRQDEKSATYRNGRKLAFHLQQLANAALTIETMGGK